MKYKEIGIGFAAHRTVNAVRSSVNLFLFFELGRGLDSFTWMSTFTLVSSIYMIIFYDSIKMDFLLIENIKRIQEEKEKTKSIYEKISNFFIKLGLIVWDPFIVGVYYRKGSYQWNNIPNMFIFLLIITSSFSSNIVGFIILKNIF